MGEAYHDMASQGFLGASVRGTPWSLQQTTQKQDKHFRQSLGERKGEAE